MRQNSLTPRHSGESRNPGRETYFDLKFGKLDTGFRRYDGILLFLTVVVFLLVGCTKEKRQRVTDAGTSGQGGPPTLSTIQPDIMTLSCAVSGCHDNRATPAANINLTTLDAAYTSLVGRNSLQLVTMKIVTPFDSDNSYLVYKLDGTHLMVGGNGAQMPQYAAALSQGQRDRIVQWILDGALKN